MSDASEYPEQFKTNGWFKDVIPQELTLRGYTFYPKNAEDIYPDGKKVCVIFPKFVAGSWKISHYKCVIHQAKVYFEGVGDTPEKCLCNFLLQALLEEFDNDESIPNGTYFKDWMKQNQYRFHTGTVEKLLQSPGS